MNDLLREVGGMDPRAAEALSTPDDVFQVPRFTGRFVSPAFPRLEGEVVIRFANVADTLEIERMVRVTGGGKFADAVSTLVVCVEKAPSTWYTLPLGAKEPVLQVERIPDVEALAALYREYSIWRSDFREQGAGSGTR